MPIKLLVINWIKNFLTNCQFFLFLQVIPLQSVYYLTGNPEKGDCFETFP